MITLEAASGTGVGKGQADARILHAHYFDAALHRAITETGTVDARASLERAAASAAYRALMAESPVNVDSIHALLASTGLGAIERLEVSEDRIEIVLAPSPYVQARLEMFGKAAAPVCDVTRGVLAGSLGAVFGRVYDVREIECVAAGGTLCVFVAAVAADAETLAPTISPFDWPAAGRLPEPDGGFPPADVLAPLAGQPGEGVSGASYGRLWAELYARAAHDFEQEVPRAMGAKFANLAAIVLTEAAHLGTFYSVGGLIRSAEWRDLVAPRLASREDWVHAIVAILDDFGWGAWRVRLLAPEQRFTVHVHDGYEALSYQAHSGTAATPRCYFARGVVAAIMNVLYAGDALAPPALNQSVYNSLFRSPLSFRAIETKCQAMGHPHCEFVANPLSPGLRLFQDVADE